MNIERLWSLWDTLSCGEEFSEVGLAIIKAFKKQLANVDDEERLKVFLQLTHLKEQYEDNIDRVIRGFGYGKEVTIKFTDVVEGPVSVMVAGGEDILVSSVEGDNIFAVLTSGNRTVNLFITPEYSATKIIFETLVELGIKKFTLGVDRSPSLNIPVMSCGIRDDSTKQHPGYDAMWDSIR